VKQFGHVNVQGVNPYLRPPLKDISLKTQVAEFQAELDSQGSCFTLAVIRTPCSDSSFHVAPCTVVKPVLFTCTDLIVYVPPVFSHTLLLMDVVSGHYVFSTVAAPLPPVVAPAPLVSEWRDMSVHEREWLAVTEMVEWEHSDFRCFLTPEQMDSVAVRFRLEKLMALN